MAIVQSNKCLFQVLVGNDYKTVMCLRSFSVNPVTTEKETTTPIDGKFKDFDYSQLSLSASLDGVAFRETTGDTLYDFAEQQLNFIEIDFRALFIDEAGNYKVFKGQAIVMSTNFEASAGNIASGTVELLCKGEYTIENTIPQFVNLRILLYNDPTAQAFFKLWLIDATGQPVFQTDVLPQASGGQLANPLDLTVPIPKGSWYYWFQVVTNDVGNVFSLNATPTKTTNFNNGVFNEGSFPTQLYDFNSNRQVSIALGVNTPPPSCVAPTLPGATLPNATQGTPYSASIAISGSQPFTLSNVVKPSWMTIAIVGGNSILFSGTPTSSGSGITVSFDVTNACGTVPFSNNINIAPTTLLPINWNFTNNTSTGTALTIYVNAVLVVNASTTSSGTINVNAGDTVQAFVIGNSFTVRHLDVQDTVASTTLHNETRGGTPLTFSWTALGLHAYEINAND